MPVSGDTSWLDPALRRAVLDHVSSERRRVFAAVIHVGLPGARLAALPLDGDVMDQSLRIDVLEAMVARHRRHAPESEIVVWLTRPGTLEVQDPDLLWAGAAHHASLELGVALPMVVVTRQGWRDPRTGTTRTWRRLRPARG